MIEPRAASNVAPVAMPFAVRITLVGSMPLRASVAVAMKVGVVVDAVAPSVGDSSRRTGDTESAVNVAATERGETLPAASVAVA